MRKKRAYGTRTEAAIRTLAESVLPPGVSVGVYARQTDGRTDRRQTDAFRLPLVVVMIFVSPGREHKSTSKLTNENNR